MLVTFDDDFIQQLRHSETRDKAFTKLVSSYKEPLYWHIRKMVLSHEDANDLLQQSFIKAWNHLDQFREQSAIYTWLYRIATNETLNFLKYKKIRAGVSFESHRKQLENTLTSDVWFSGDALQLALQKAILRLPEKQRLVFNMRYFDEMPYEQMSEILGTSVGALKASYHLAAKKIETFLNVTCHE